MDAITITKSAGAFYAALGAQTIGHVDQFCDDVYVYLNATEAVQNVPTVAAGIAALVTLALAEEEAPYAADTHDAEAAYAHENGWDIPIEDDDRDYEPPFHYHPQA